jgi:large subunit ribosomal protein L25
MSEQTTALLVTRREPAGSRSARRLRREGQVLGTVYGGGQDPVSIQVDARLLRNTLAHANAVLDLQIDGEQAEPVVLKERNRHPVSGETMHVDFLRVDLAKKIQSQVPIELTDTEDSDVRIGGVLEHTLREVTIEAIPTAIPDVITLSVKGLKVGAFKTIADIVAPKDTEIIGDPEAVVATVRTSRGMRSASDSGSEIELETEVIGEANGSSDGDAAGA